VQSLFGEGKGEGLFWQVFQTCKDWGSLLFTGKLGLGGDPINLRPCPGPLRADLPEGLTVHTRSCFYSLRAQWAIRFTRNFTLLINLCSQEEKNFFDSLVLILGSPYLPWHRLRKFHVFLNFVSPHKGSIVMISFISKLTGRETKHNLSSGCISGISICRIAKFVRTGTRFWLRLLFLLHGGKKEKSTKWVV